MPNSGEIVAVRASTGEVLAVAQHQASGALPAAGALNAKLAPGTAFTIVSAAALAKKGVSPSTSIPCASSFNVGGQTFTSEGTGAAEAVQHRFRRGLRHGVRRAVRATHGERVGPGGQGVRHRLRLVAAAGAGLLRFGALHRGRSEPGGADHRPGQRADEPAVHGHGGRHGRRGPLARPAGAPGLRSAQCRRRPGRGRDEHGARAHARRGPVRCRPGGQPSRSAGVRPGRHWCTPVRAG